MFLFFFCLELNCFKDTDGSQAHGSLLSHAFGA